MSTQTIAVTDCIIPTTTACLPVPFSCESLNSFPIENAMNPRATVEMISTPWTSSNELKPNPGSPSAPRQYGPTSTPAIRNAVTSGKLRCMILNSRVIISPANMAIARDSSSVDICSLENLGLRIRSTALLSYTALYFVSYRPAANILQSEN